MFLIRALIIFISKYLTSLCWHIKLLLHPAVLTPLQFYCPRILENITLDHLRQTSFVSTINTFRLKTLRMKMIPTQLALRNLETTTNAESNQRRRPQRKRLPIFHHTQSATDISEQQSVQSSSSTTPSDCNSLLTSRALISPRPTEFVVPTKRRFKQVAHRIMLTANISLSWRSAPIKLPELTTSNSLTNMKTISPNSTEMIKPTTLHMQIKKSDSNGNNNKDMLNGKVNGLDKVSEGVRRMTINEMANNNDIMSTVFPRCRRPMSPVHENGLLMTPMLLIVTEVHVQHRVHAIDKCAHCDNVDKYISICGNCRHVAYCSKACQLAHWPEHKHVCKYISMTHFGSRNRDSVSWYIKCEWLYV